MENKMMARPKYNRSKKLYNVVANYNGQELLIGSNDGIFVEYTEFGDKQSAINYINSKEKLKLANNLKEMILGNKTK